MQTQGLFITGTDTSVGKTYVTSLIARDLVNRGIPTGAYKPVCSGADFIDRKPIWHDVELLHTAIGSTFPRERICPQCFQAPLAPPAAARLESSSVDRELMTTAALWWKDQVDVLLVEGVGGLLCPITVTITVADLAVELGYPLVVVCRLSLGAINHTLLTVEAARQRDLVIAGLILNHTEPSPPSNDAVPSTREEISRRAGVPILAEVAYRQNDPIVGYQDHLPVDWLKLASTR